VADLRLAEKDGQSSRDDGDHCCRGDQGEQRRRTRPRSETTSTRDARDRPRRGWQGVDLGSQPKRRRRQIGAPERLAKLPIERIRFWCGSAHREATFPLT
jgi:hypothetical protein